MRGRRTRTSGCCWSSALSRRSPRWPRSSGSLARSRTWRAGRRPAIWRWSALTLLSAWAFMQLMFALHYAGVYFHAPQGRRCAAASSFRATRSRTGWSSSIRPSPSAAPSPPRTSMSTLEADAADRRHSGHRLLLLQHDHPRADDQHRREPLLAAAFAGYRATMTDTADVSPAPAPRCRAASPIATPPTSPPPRR